MEAIRSKLGGNAASPEERAKHQQQLVLPNIGSILISTVMVVIGAQVINNRVCHGFRLTELDDYFRVTFDRF
jgi:hypothetical protein